MAEASKQCLDCGKAITTGQRCRKCNGAWIKLRAAIDAQAGDRILLGMVENEGLNAGRVAQRLNITRPAADRRLKAAYKRREVLRAATPTS